MKEFGLQKIIIDKIKAMRTYTIFPDCITKGLCLFYHDIFQACFNKRGYSYSMIEHKRANQLLQQLLVELFDTLYIQC